MKLHLPKTLRVALLAALAFVAQPAMASVTFDNLKEAVLDKDNHVYYNGTGTFTLQTESCVLDMTLTLDLASMESYMGVHDYHGSSPFVTWTYTDASAYGLADANLSKNDTNAPAITGYWNDAKWTNAGQAWVSDLRTNYAVGDTLTLRVCANPGASSSADYVQVYAVNNGAETRVYSGDGLRSGAYASKVVESFTVNTNYVTALTLNSTSVKDLSDFTPPPNYMIPFKSQLAEDDPATVGRIMFMGDSITHGVHDQTWRWQIFKTFVDNGIENEIAGPREGYDTNNLPITNMNDAGSVYGGAEFANVHYAQSSGRTFNMVTGGNKVAPPLNTGSWGVTYSGISAADLGKRYDCNTYVMMMGTNDILSNTNNNETAERYATVMQSILGGTVTGTSNADGSRTFTRVSNDDWGNFGEIISGVNMGEGDTFYVMAIPTWTQHGNHNGATDHASVQAYNELLKDWCTEYSAQVKGTVKYVDINKGLVDVTHSTPFYAPKDFFINADGLHPSQQGSLIIAGNLAKGMGIGGRTAGLERSAANAAGWTSFTEASVSLSSGETRQLLHDVFTQDGGYTIDFSAVFGNGAENGWLDGEKAVNVAASNALSITIGDGANFGTLNLAEGYIMWGNSVLYCRDNSLSSNESLRIAYHNGNTGDNVASGYYVWLGDMLIGQGLGNQTGTAINGVVVSATGATGTLSNLSYTNTAYAPTTTLTVGANPYVVTQAAGNTELIHTPELDVLPALGNHDNTAAKGLGVDFSSAGSAASGATAVNASSPAGEVVVTMTSSGNYYGAVQGFTRASGDVTVNVTGGTAANNAFGVVNGSLTDGNVTMVFSNDVTVKSGTYGTTTGAFMGAFRGDIGGSLNVEVQNATLEGSIFMGVVNTTSSNSIGSVNLVVGPGATVKGDIQGGSTVAAGTINGDINLTVNGGHVTGNIVGSGTAGTVNGDIAITVTGGIIDGDITAKQSSGVTYASGKTGTVTVEGNLAKIGGNITADTVTLKDVAQSEYSDTFDKYAGTISAAKVVLDNYTADELQATLAGSVTVSATNGTSTAFSKSTTIDTLQLEEGTKLGFNADSTLSNANQNTNGTVLVNGATLMLGKEQNVGNTTQTYNRVEINDAVLKSGAKGDNNVRNISTLSVAGDSRLEQFSWHTLWNIGSLTDVEGAEPGTLTWQMDCNHYNTSIMKLTEEGDFSGKLVVARNCPNTSNGTYQAYLQVDNTKALQNATVKLDGTKTNDMVAMALNNAAVTIGGLEGTANSIVYAGEAKTKPGNAAPVSTGTSVLTINTAGDHTYAGTIAAGVSLALKGSGTQTLSGNTTLGGVSVANGTTLNYEGGTHAITEQSATSAVSNMVVKKGASVELSGSSTITNLSVNNSSMTFNGGKHTITNLDANDENVAAGSVTIQGGAEVAVSGRLRIGAKGETYTIQGGGSLALTGQNVKIEAASDSVAATLNSTNTANSGYYTYNSGDNYSENFKIENAKVTLSGTKNLKNKLVNSSVVADTDAAGGVSVSNGNNTLTGVTAQKGNLVVTNAANSKETLKEICAAGGNVDIRDLGAGASVSLHDLLIGNSRTVTALVSGASIAADESNVAKVLVTGELNAMTGAKLNANLTMATGSTLKVADKGLELGCTLTLNEGINLGDEQLETLHTTGALTLFTGVDAITLASVGIDNGIDAITLEQGIDAGLFFNLPTAASVTAPTPSYVIVYSGASNGGVVSLTVVPEPATATLSLLALAALAARRRRH